MKARVLVVSRVFYWDCEQADKMVEYSVHYSVVHWVAQME